MARIERLQAELDESSPNLPLSCVKAKRPVKTRFLSAQAQHVCA